MNNIRFATLNVCGLKSKLIGEDFQELLLLVDNNDIVGIYESKLSDVDVVEIDNFDEYTNNRGKI